MYEYRLVETKKWVEKLLKTKESGTIIGLPLSGKLRTIESAFDSLNISDQCKIVDLSVLPHRYLDTYAILSKALRDFAGNGGKLVYLDNCSLNTKTRRRQIKALNSIRTELGRRYFYIYSFNEDISLRQNLIAKFSCLASLNVNVFYFPYANQQETVELIHQNEDRFDIKIKPSDHVKIYHATSGVPFLIKSYFRDGEVSQDSLNRFVTEFTSRQFLELKTPASSIIQSYSKLGMLDPDGKFISQNIGASFANHSLPSKLLIDKENKTIELNRASILPELSSYESEILYKLGVDRRISRQEIATICYGQQKSADYSDYAIDKIMSRLRQTLIRLGCNSDIIKTNRGYGYSLNNGK